MIQIERFMIGDWVLFTDPDEGVREYHQIEAADYGQDERYYKCFDPIPITPDIIKANGGYIVEVGDNGPATPKVHFMRYEKWQLVTKWNTAVINYDRTTKHWNLRGVNAVNLDCVHDLQHALRFVHLDDLADNFKIEEGGLK